MITYPTFVILIYIYNFVCRCVQTIRVHSEAVWALLATESFSHVISGGRDKQVIVTELRNPHNSTIVCIETAPILRLCFTADNQSIWVKKRFNILDGLKDPEEKLSMKLINKIYFSPNIKVIITIRIKY